MESKRGKQKTAQTPVMVKLKNRLRSNILETIKPFRYNKTAFPRNQKPSWEPIKLKEDQGVQAVAKKGKTTTKQLPFAGMFAVWFAWVAWGYHSNAEAGDTSGDCPSNPPAQHRVSQSRLLPVSGWGISKGEASSTCLGNLCQFNHPQ